MGEEHAYSTYNGDDIHNQTQCENGHVSYASDIRIVDRRG